MSSQYGLPDEVLIVDADSPFQTVQAAVDAGGKHIFVAPGTYEGQLIFNGDNINIVGAGINQTILKLPDGTDDHLITSDGVQRFFCGLRDLTLDGNKANNSSGYGVYMDRAHTWTLRDLHIKNANRGIELFGDSDEFALNNRMRDLRIEDSVGPALKVGAFSPNNHVSGCIIGGTTSFSCLEIQNDETIVIGCHVHGAAVHGIDVSGDRNIIVNSVIEGSGTNGLNFGSGADNNVYDGIIAFNNSGADVADGGTNNGPGNKELS